MGQELADTGLKMINARLETARERPAFRRAFERFRCLIVADGFYEWRRGAGPTGSPKQPFHITRDDGGLFAFAGLWSIWHGDDDRVLRTCTILTTAANSAIAPLHDRMPVILDPEGEREWLDTSTPSPRLAEILAGLPAAHTELTEVGFAVNDARYDGPECLAPPPPATQEALFSPLSGRGGRAPGRRPAARWPDRSRPAEPAARGPAARSRCDPCSAAIPPARC